MPQFLAEPEDHGTIAQSASGNRQNVLFFPGKTTFIKTSTNACALPQVFKFHFSMHIYNSQLTTKIQNKSEIS
jgi:hypothetical protein